MNFYNVQISSVLKMFTGQKIFELQIDSTIQSHLHDHDHDHLNDHDLHVHKHRAIKDDYNSAQSVLFSSLLSKFRVAKPDPHDQQTRERFGIQVTVSGSYYCTCTASQTKSFFATVVCSNKSSVFFINWNTVRDLFWESKRF